MPIVPVAFSVETAQDLEDQLNAVLAPLTADRIMDVVIDQIQQIPFFKRNLSVALTYETGAAVILTPFQFHQVSEADENQATTKIQEFIAANPGYFFSPIISVYRPQAPDPTQGVIIGIFYNQDPAAASNWGGGGGGGDPTLGGDLSGTASSATVVGVQGVPLSANAPSSGDTWIYNAAASEWVPGPAFSYYVSGAAAQAAAPHINGTYVVISPGSPTSDAGTYQITTNGGAAFPADYTKLSDHTDTAGEVGVVDAGNYYGGTDVEAVLQEIGAGLVSGPTGTLLVATNVIDSILATACEGGDWQILLENGTLRYKTTLSVAHDGATASATESASVPGPGVGVLPVTFDADISGGQLRILATASAVGWSYRVRRLALMVV